MQINLTQEEQDYIKSQYIERLINYKLHQNLDSVFENIEDNSIDLAITSRLTTLIKSGTFDKEISKQFINLIQDESLINDIIVDSNIYDLLSEKCLNLLKEKL